MKHLSRSRDQKNKNKYKSRSKSNLRSITKNSRFRDNGLKDSRKPVNNTKLKLKNDFEQNQVFNLLQYYY